MYVFFLILIQLCDSRKAIRVISVFSVKFNVDFTRQAVNFSIILLSLKKRYMGKREKCKNWNKCPFLSGMILSLNLSKCCQIISGMNPQSKALRNMTLTRDELTSKRMGMTSFQNFQNKLYFQSEQQCRQHALYSHKARYNKPIRILVRMVQIIWLAVQD